MIGVHLLADFYGVEAPLLCEESTLRDCLLAAAQKCGLTPLGEPRMHIFPGGGLTGFLMLSESHIAIHTYPEHGYLALDIFSCGEGDIRQALQVFQRALQPSRVHTNCVNRGEDIDVEDWAT
jgi:S-adenosylmethionine decarboxylase proenzyme